MGKNEKQIIITPPEGFEVDLETSDLAKGVINFKSNDKSTLSYDLITTKLFKRGCSFIGDRGTIKHTRNGHIFNTDLNNGTTSEQLESLLTLNKLINIAAFLNCGWTPNWNSEHEIKYFIYYNKQSDRILIGTRIGYYESSVFFKTLELAEKAIEILGKNEIIKALTLNY